MRITSETVMQLDHDEAKRLSHFLEYAACEKTLVPQWETLELTQEHGFTVFVRSEVFDFVLKELY